MKPAIKALFTSAVFYLAGVLSVHGQALPHRAGILSEEFLYLEADFPQCHSATILELQGGELLCAFFGGTRERHPDVEIRLCHKKPGGSWSAPVSIADGVQADGSRLPTWNPVLFQPKNGPVYLFYKVGPSPSKWWGMVKTSTDGGKTWSDAKKLKEPIIGPVKNKPVQLANGIVLSGSSTELNGWKCHIERSEDQGKTWSFIGPLNDGRSIGAIQPTLLTYGGDSIQLLARTKFEEKGYIAESWSFDQGLTWSKMKATNLPNNNSGIDGVTLRDGSQLLVYNHSTRTQPGMGHKGRGVLNVALTKNGRDWDAALVLDYIDEPEKQFSYPAVIQTADGLVHIVYTWHRKRIKHVVIDPSKLETYPIKNRKWPIDQIPLITSKDAQ
ncbi:sialidase family protein [Niabella insulamsoli]|uniref:sialidase family protein n=1 Tax=Niabella insulamsoli TaxID=3144874 RepID=UPI0031FBEBAC